MIEFISQNCINDKKLHKIDLIHILHPLPHAPVMDEDRKKTPFGEGLHIF